MKNLANTLNNFDIYFSMSDDNRVYSEGLKKQNELKAIVKNLTEDEKKEVIATLRQEVKDLFFPAKVKNTFKVGDTVKTLDGTVRVIKEVINTQMVRFEALEGVNIVKEFTANLELVVEPKVKSTIMTTAWSFVKKGIYNTISEALKASWRKHKLVTKMKKGIAHFTFRKKNGELREAIGTLREGNFEYKSKGNKDSNYDVVKYFDVVADAFRSFRIERLVA